MIKFKLLLYTFLFLLLAQNTFGQNDHLEPVRDFTKYGSGLKEYYTSVIAKVTQGLSPRPLAQQIVLPSFSSEYAISIECDTNMQYFIKANYLNNSYWYSEDKSNVKSIFKQRLISSELAQTTQKVFRTALSQVRKPLKDMMGLDGETYLFYTYSESKGLIGGETWSPEIKSKMGAFVTFCNHLLDFVFNKPLSEEALIIEAKKIHMKLTEY